MSSPAKKTKQDARQNIPPPGGFWHRIYGKAPHAFNALIICILVFLAYGRSLGHDFAWDDIGLIVENSHVKSISGLRSLLFDSFWSLGENVEDTSRSFYRPLISLSYALDYGLGGVNPFGYHLTNLIGHALAGLMAYVLCFILCRQRWAALLTAGLFAVHPSHVENVSWVAGRTDVFCGAFYFLALTAYVALNRNPFRWRRYMPVLLGAYGAALMSKETAVTLPVIIIVYELLISKNLNQAHVVHREIRFRAWASTILVTGGYLVMRSAVLGKAIAPASFGSAWERSISIPLVFAKYLGGLLSIVPLDPHHDAVFISRVSDPRLLVGLVVCGVFAGLLLFARRRRGWIGLFWLLWIPLTLAPTFKLGSFGDVLTADRFMYIPSLGFAAALVWVVRGAVWSRAARVPVLQHGILGCYGMLLMIWIGMSATYTGIWKDSYTLFSYAVKTSPKSSYVFLNLGNSFAARGEYEKAVTAYTHALKLEADVKEIYVNMGVSLDQLGRHEDALSCYQKAIALGDHSTVAYSHVANSYRMAGDFESAITWYCRSLDLESTSNAHINLGGCYLAEDKLDLAERHFRSALAIEPKPIAWYNLALVSSKQGDDTGAVAHLEQALAMKRQLTPELEETIQSALGQLKPPTP